MRGIVEAVPTRFTLNGSPVEVGDHPHLLAALREELDVTSPKDGCSPSGQCGCCTVLLGGKPVVSCTIGLDRVDGKDVTTLEGLPADERERYAAAFATTGALQCGFCTPGIVMRTKYLVDKDGSALTRDKAARHLGGHLCRCTGYHPILDAVDLLTSGAEVPVPWPTAATPSSGVATEGPDGGARPTWGVGSRNSRYQAGELALGDKDYVDDMRVPGLLHAAAVLAEHARADVVAIDTAAAEAVPGVERVLTAADVPGDLRIGLIHRDWPVFVPVGGRTSYTGDVLALVVAGDRATARRAAELVAVDYAPLAPFADALSALDSTEPAVWQVGDPATPNVLSRSVYARSDHPDGLDADAALAASAHTVHEVFQTQRIEHAFLEPESTLVVPRDDGTLEVFSGGQGVWDDRRQIADVLGIAEDRVLVHLVANGGAFGGKEDCANQAQTALAAWLLGRPVKCTFSREESLRVHPKRHPVRVEAWAGCDADGRAHRAQGPHRRRLGSVRVGGHEGARTSRRPRQRALRLAGGRRRRRRRPHQQPRVRRLPRLRGQPGPVRHRGPARPAGRRRGDRPVGDPGPQRRDPGIDLGAGPGDGRRLPRRPRLPRRGEAAVGRRRGRRARPWASGSASRTRASATGSRRWRRRSCASTTTSPRATEASRSATAGPRWARACTPSPCRWRCRSWGSIPPRCGCSSTRPGSWAPARRPGAGAR